MSKDFAADYIDVATRIKEFREKHPEGSLQPVKPREPYDIVNVEGRFFIVYTAAAYRTPDDRRPGIGVAWEPFPGPTPFTKDSELQNAETSAWGRAIVAALAADTKSGVASADEVRNRSGSGSAAPQATNGNTGQGTSLATDKQRRLVVDLIERKDVAALTVDLPDAQTLTKRQASEWIDRLQALDDNPPATRVSTLREGTPA